MGPYLGDVLPFTTFVFNWDTFSATGASIAPSGGTIVVYKDTNTTESTAGVTDTRSFDGRTGINQVVMSLTADQSFYSLGSSYSVMYVGGTIDGQAVNAVLFTFSILRDALKYGIARAGVAQAATSTTVTVDAAAAFGNNVPSDMTMLLYSSTQQYVQSRRVTTTTGDVMTVQEFVVPPGGTYYYVLVATPPVAINGASLRTELGLSSANMDTQFSNTYAGVQNIQNRIPLALVGNRMDSNVGSVAGVAVQQNGSGTQNMGGP
jgi:hypothetical protein